MASTKLSAVLDEAFRALTGRDGGAFDGVRDQASFLGISVGQYSRIRNMRSPLTERTAAKWGAALSPSDPAGLESELLAAARQRSLERDRDSLILAADLFERLGRDGTLLCVEYRDRPRAEALAKYAQLAARAGKAIARGMSFAAFQPFCTPEIAEKSRRCDERYREYVHDLGTDVRRVYQQIRDHAVQGVTDDNAKAAIRNRIVLYESNNKELLGSGIQSRVFHAATRTEVGGIEEEVWEWVASRHDLFVQRDEVNTPPPAMSGQFFPVTAAWRGTGRLPLSNDELQRAAEDYAEQHKLEEPFCPWVVYQQENARDYNPA